MSSTGIWGSILISFNLPWSWSKRPESAARLQRSTTRLRPHTGEPLPHPMSRHRVSRNWKHNIQSLTLLIWNATSRGFNRNCSALTLWRSLRGRILRHKGDIRIWIKRRKPILWHLVRSAFPRRPLNGKLILISYRFSYEATYSTSYRFLCEATGTFMFKNKRLSIILPIG